MSRDEHPHHVLEDVAEEAEREVSEATTNLLTAEEQPSLLAAMGGPRGMVESGAPTLAFVIATTAGAQTKTAAIIAVALAVVAAVARIARRDTPQFAVVGMIGVGISAWLAGHTGQARNFFVPGFFLNGGYGLAVLISVAVRRPLAGFLVAGFGGEDRWWEDPVRLKVFRTVSLLWAAIFIVRPLVQVPLYYANDTVALGTARLAMGYPLFGIAIWLSWLMLRPVTGKRPAAD